MSLSGIEAKARRNFQNAVVALQEAVPKETRTSLEQIKVTEFNNTSSIDSAAAEIDEMMEQIVSGMEKQRLGGSRTHRVKENLKRYFQSSFHFAQIFLMVAKDASAVPALNPCGVVCSALLILLNAAYEESRRGEEIATMLDSFSTSVSRIHLLKSLPKDMDKMQLAKVQCASLNLCAAILKYLTVALQYLNSSFQRNLVRGLFTGSTNFDDALTQIYTATNNYNSALDDFGLIAVMDTRLNMQGLSSAVDKISQKMDSLLSYDSVDPMDTPRYRLRPGNLHDTGPMRSPDAIHSAGAGKTVVTSLVIDALQAKFNDKNTGIAYTYLDYTDQAQHSTFKVLASLLKQLALRAEDMIPELYALHETSRARGTLPKIEHILRALKSSFALFSRNFIILDALDECEQRERVLLLNCFKQLLSEDVKLFTTSRPHLRDVHEFFERASCVTIRADPADIRNFLTRTVEERISRYPQLKRKIVDKLSISARGVFLLGEAQLNYVLRFKDPRNMKSALESSVPSQLFDVYETVMETISQSSDDSKLLALTILSWLFYAKRPLQITELREAIAVRDGDVDIEEEDMMLPEDIVEVCGSFVALDRGSGVVGFSHQTVQEFLRTRYLLQLLPEQDMAKTCLTYLLFDEFENGPSSTESSFQERFRQRPFGRYAARFWGVHIKQADVEMDIGIQTMLVRLIGSSYKLDAMSQLARAETAADWDDERSGWERKKALIHILAENNFVKLARAILPQETIVVTLDRPTEEILILGDGQLDVEQRTQTGWTALHFAAKEGSVDMIDLLLSAKAEVEAQTENGHRPLAIAAFRGHKKAVMKFLDAKADVQARSLRGASALYHAAGNGHLEVVDILLKANGDVTAEVDLGIASLQRASIGGHVYVVKRLLKAGAQVDAHANIASALSCAAIRGHIKVVNVLLEANADVNIQDDVGCGALHFAARNGHTEVVQRLLEANADVNMRDAANQTALFWASSSGHSSVVKALVDAHADVNAQNENGGTALHMACSLGYEEVIVILLAAKANVWLQDQDGWTSLHHAAKHGLVYAVRALLSESKNRGSSGMNSAGHTTAHDGNQSQTSEARAMEGIVFSHTQNIRQLPDTSSKVKGYVPDEERDTAPELVPRDGRSICSARTNIGVRAIHLAAAYGHYEVAKSLLVADKDDGYRTLHGSACNGTGSINVADTPALPTAATHADSIPPLEVSEKLRWYCRLTSIYPEDHFFRKDLADMYIRAGMIPLAVSSFDIALTLDPFSAAAILVGEIIHRNKCDSCDVKRITGYRHKCLTCPDYDLCDNCFQVTPRPHSSHNFITIPSQEWVSKGL